MDVLKTGATFSDEVATLAEHWDAYDFFFVHYKDTDKAGEDGDFDAKVVALERFDTHVPKVRALGPDVLVVSGDHATPSVLAAHGWQPVPALLWSRYCGADPVTAFTERACAAGTLGTLPAHHLMPLVMANALRLTKFGA
jgi:2,3-bisphosphoglycerate-independent phosphoglycerate mutase